MKFGCRKVGSLYICGMFKLGAILFVLAIVHTVLSAEYGPNQELTECKPCDKFCNRKPPVCGGDCDYQNGLYWKCRTGYVRLSDNVGDGCVLPENCPKQSN